MAQTINITNRYNNQDKRYAEAVVMTVPTLLEEGGVRLSTPPVYLQYGDAVTSATVEADTIIKGAYLVIDEALPAGSLVNVDIAGTSYFVGVDGTVEGLTVSAESDNLLKNGQTITVSVTGGSGDITSGLFRVVLDVVTPSLKNGNYSVWA
jgi:hypothetical protein